MKPIHTAAMVASLMLAAVPAFAQEGAKGGAASGAVAGAVGGALVGGPIGAVIGGVAGAAAGAAVGDITTEDRVYVQKYVYDQKLEPVVVQEKIVVGKPLPGTVKTYTFEGNPRLAKYRYAYVNKQYLLVDANGNVVGSIEK